jgi:GT2 family glycosyltransferase
LTEKGALDLEELMLGHALRNAAWLSEEVLLLACAPDSGLARIEEDTARHRSPAITVPAKVFVAPLGTIFAATPPADTLEEAGPIAFVDEGRGEALLVDAETTARALTDVRTLLRSGPAGWDAAARTELLSFLAELGAEQGLSLSLSAGLLSVREALRERQPVTVEDRRAARGVVVERLHRIDDNSYYVRGRAWDGAGEITRLTATSPEGERVELLDAVISGAPEDGGFLGLFHTASPSRGRDGWVMEAASELEHAVECSAGVAPDARSAILTDASLDFAEADTFLSDHALPAVSRLNELQRASVTVADVKAYGRPRPSPAVSIVVPLQRRIDLIEHHLAQFGADPALSECELLYVLDDPEQHDLLQELAGELFRLYELPFRVATLSAPGGLAHAFDLGASLALADRLAFLDGDILPDRPGWLDALAAALDADAEAGAAGPKLLYEDEAINQAGLEYVRATGREWRVEHRFRGMHRAVQAAEGGGPVAALGISCLMIDAVVFSDVGGLSAEYGESEYEGSDLCRRLGEAGRRCLYAPAAEVYRLEGLGAAPESKGGRYARWLHDRIWGDAIEQTARGSG